MSLLWWALSASWSLLLVASALALRWRSLLRDAERDDATGLLGRKAFIRRADPRAKRRGGWLLFLDIDRFKRINEMWGHDGGDVVLHTIADRVSGHFGPDVLIGRYGGDEISVLLTGGSPAKRLEGLLAKVAEPIFYGSESVNVTVTIGQVPVNTARTQHIKDALKRGSAAMFEARGRPVRISADPDDAEPQPEEPEDPRLFILPQQPTG